MNTISGYAEIKLSTGEVIPLKYGMWTFRELCRKWDVQIEGIIEAAQEQFKKDSITTSFVLIGTGAEYASRALGKPATYDEATVSTWIDDTRGQASDQAMAAFLDALGTIYSAQPAEGTEAAKDAGNAPAPEKGQ